MITIARSNQHKPPSLPHHPPLATPQTTHPTTTTTAPPPFPPPILPPAAASPGTTFPTAPVSPACPPTKQLAVPHSYPLGQHPATGPASRPHKNHPPAHCPAPVVAGLPSPTGTTTVTPSVATIVVITGGGGQLVVWQSRPVWQHPAPAEARHG